MQDSAATRSRGCSIPIHLVSASQLQDRNAFYRGGKSQTRPNLAAFAVAAAAAGMVTALYLELQVYPIG
jgi:hypothetical protein